MQFHCPYLTPMFVLNLEIIRKFVAVSRSTPSPCDSKFEGCTVDGSEGGQASSFYHCLTNELWIAVQ